MNNIYTKQKLILEKLAIANTFERAEEREEIVFQDLPLKNNQDLVIIEKKLKNDPAYRNQMVSPIFNTILNVEIPSLKTSSLLNI